MPKYFDKVRGELPQAAFGIGIDDISDVASSVRERATSAGKRIYKGVRRDVKDIAEDFTSFDADFTPVRNPRDVLSNILEGVRAGTYKGAEITGDLGAILGRRMALSPFSPLLADLAPQSAQRTVGRGGEVAGRIVGSMAPYVAASILAPEVAIPAITAQSAALVLSAADRYERGLIDGRQALTEVALEVGPMMVGPTLRGLAAGGRKLGLLGSTPAGRRTVAAALESSETGGPPAKPRRASKRTVEEAKAYSDPERTVEHFLATSQKEREMIAQRIARAQQRVVEPLGMRPRGRRRGALPPVGDVVGAKGTGRSIYYDDIATVDGHLYSVRQLQADAGETELRPVITAGSFRWSGRGGAEKRVYLTIQEAEVLRDLYSENPSPTVAQIRRALEKVEGRQVKTPKKKGAADKFIEEAELREAGSEVVEEGAEGAAPRQKSQRTATTKRAQLVKEYIEKRASKSEYSIERPLPPVVRDALQRLRLINDEVSALETRREELDRLIARARRDLAKFEAEKAPASVVRQELKKYEQKVRDEANSVTQKLSRMSRSNPKREALVNRSVELEEMLAQVREMLNGAIPIPDEFLAAAKDRMRSNLRYTNLKNTLAQHEEEWRATTGLLEGAERKRAELLGTDEVPGDPRLQAKILFDKLGLASGQPPILPPSRARAILDEVRRYSEEFRLKAQETIKKETRRLKRIEELEKAINSGLTGGRIPAAGKLNEAARLFEEWKVAREARDANPGGINRPAVAVEPLENFTNLALLRANSEALGEARMMRAMAESAGAERQLSMMEYGRAILRNLAHELSNVRDMTFGPGGRPFVEVDGERIYGHIRMVQPAETLPPSEWLVDFVPEFTPSRSIIRPGLRVKDISVEYRKVDASPDTKGYDAIERRYQYERDIIADLRSIEEQTVLQGETPESILKQQKITEVRQQHLAGLKPLDITESYIRTPDQLNEEVRAAWSAFENTLMPPPPSVGNSITAQARLINEGFLEMWNSPLPKSKQRAQTTVAARQAIATDYRDYILENAGVDVFNNPLIKDVFDAQGDPVRLVAYLRGRSIDPEDIVREPGAISNIIPRRVRGVMDFMMGRAMPDMRVRGINTNYFYARKAIAANIFRNFGGLVQQARKLAVKELQTVGGQRVSKRPRWLRFSYGDTELQTVLAKSFDPNAKVTDVNLRRGLQAIADLPVDIRDEVYDIMSRELRWAFDYPELFPNMSDDMRELGRLYRGMVQRINDAAVADSGKTVSNGYLNRLMVSEQLRDKVDAKAFTEGHPLEALANAAQVAHNQGLNLREHLALGDDLLNAEPLAYWESSLKARVAQQIRQLAPDIAESDIEMLPGRFTIKSLDKFKVFKDDGGVDWPATRDLQTSIKQLQTSINRLPDWRGLQRASHALSQLVLTADANIVSVQGYSAVSSRVLYDLASIASGRKFRNVDALGNYLQSMKDIVSDEGFHTWYMLRADDIQYYSSLGMSIGFESFVAGPTLNKLPLENVPMFGKLPQTVREFNDLQFNRMLLYLKVTSIDNMLSKAKLFRKIGPTSSQAWLKLPGIKSVVDEAAGPSPYIQGQPEYVVKAAIRAVNNKLGGIDMNAQGIVQWRQVAEQIMSITPGFLRAQAGMLTTALSRPHTVEGWLALTGIAEEVAFAAGVATMIAMATGNMDKLNLTDMTRPDWMAAPFEDGYVQIVPRVGIPRLAARILRETIDASHGEEFNVGPPIQAFAMGRMSPLVSAILGPTFFDEDFIGRRYRDKKDRAFAALTSFMPIFAENLATEARENVARDGWGSLTGLAYQTPLQFVGKNITPRPPIEKMDEYALQYSSQTGAPRKWYDLTPDEQEKLLENPAIRAAHEDLKYWQERRASPREQRIEAQFRLAEERVDALRTKPFNYNGVTMSMADAWKLLQAGEIDGDDYRERLRYVNGRIAEIMDTMEANLLREGFDLSERGAERQERLREIFKGADDNTIQTQLAVWDVQMIQPEDFTETKVVTTPDGNVEIEEIDWDAYDAARQATLKEYPEHIRVMAQEAMNKWEDEGVDAYRQASELRKEIEELPRYRGIDNAQADKVDAMTHSFRDLRDAVRAKIGLPGSLVPLPEGMGRVLRAYALKSFAEQGFLKTQDDVKLAALAIMMEEEPLIREAMRAPQRLNALIQNPIVLLFYPYLLRQVPVWARGQLPQNLQPRFDIMAAYQQLAG